LEKSSFLSLLDICFLEKLQDLNSTKSQIEDKYFANNTDSVCSLVIDMEFPNKKQDFLFPCPCKSKKAYIFLLKYYTKDLRAKQEG